MVLCLYVPKPEALEGKVDRTAYGAIAIGLASYQPVASDGPLGGPSLNRSVNIATYKISLLY